MTYNILGLIILILDILAIVQIVSSGRSAAYKIGWSLAIILLPLIGLILYAIFGGMTAQTATNH